MQIRVYIDPNGDVTITTLLADLVPVAYALDQADQQMHHWLDALSETAESRLSESGESRQSEPHSTHQKAPIPKQDVCTGVSTVIDAGVLPSEGDQA